MVGCSAGAGAQASHAQAVEEPLARMCSLVIMPSSACWLQWQNHHTARVAERPEADPRLRVRGERAVLIGVVPIAWLEVLARVEAAYQLEWEHVLVVRMMINAAEGALCTSPRDAT